jgi:hypothetical protein
MSHADAEAAGLPFPPLLRKQLFDARGMPDWYCPTRRAPPLAAGWLVFGAALALAAAVAALAGVTHRRVHTLPTTFAAVPAACARSGGSCRAALHVALPAALAADATLDPAVTVAGTPAQIVALAISPGRRRLTLWLDWPPGRVRPARATVAFAESRSLLGWLAPRRAGAPAAQEAR